MSILPQGTSLPTKVWESTFQRYKFSNYIPYESYDDVTSIYRTNLNEYGAILEIVPRILMGTQTAVTFQELLEKIPDDIDLQIVMFGSRNNNELIDNWIFEHQKRANAGDEYANVLTKAVQNMAEHHRDNHSRSVSRRMQARLRNIRVFVCVKGKDKGVVSSTRGFVRDLLRSNNFAPSELLPEKLKPIAWEIFNGQYPLDEIPEYDERKELNLQLIAPNTKITFSDTHVNMGGRYWKNMSPLSYSKYATINDFGDKLGDYLSSVMDTNQFNDSFLLTLNVKRLPKKERDGIKKSHDIIMAQPWGERFREFWKRKNESGDILDRIQNQEHLYTFDMNVICSGETEEEMEANAETIRSYWNKGGEYSAVRLASTDSIHQLAFMAALPLGVTNEYYETTQKYDKRFGEEIAQFLPLESDWRGTNPNLLLYSRRAQLSGLDVFVSNNNFNGYVIATSGAGKSVLLNNLAMTSYARDNMVFIVDIGGSFAKLCEVVGGQYIEPDPNNPKSFNPFSDIKTEGQLNDDLEYLSGFIYMLGATKSIAKSDEVEKLIKTKIQKLIVELYKDYGNKLETTYLRDALQKEDDPRFKDFSDQLGAYSRGGLYEKFFCGPSEIDLQKEFIVAEMGKIENDEGIRDPLIMMLLYHVGNKMYHGTHGKKMQIIMDECHKFLGKNARMDDFIEQAYRRARKHGASIIIATQGFDDVYNAGEGKLSKAGVAIINNSAWKFFLKQTGTSINMLINSNVFNFSPLEEDLLRSVHTEKGEFSEIFIITPDEAKMVMRLVMDRFFYYMTSTDTNDKAKIKKMQEVHGVDMATGIELLIQEEMKEKNGAQNG